MHGDESASSSQRLPPLRLSFRVLAARRDEFLHPKTVQWNTMRLADGSPRTGERPRTNPEKGTAW